MKSFRLALWAALSASVAFSISDNCTADIQSLLATQTLLTQAIDSFGKPVGAFRGSFSSLGDYVECTELIDADLENPLSFRYALVEGALILQAGNAPIPPLASSLGVCFPSQCDKDDITEGMGLIFEFLKSKLGGGGPPALDGVSQLAGQSSAFFRAVANTAYSALFDESAPEQPGLNVAYIVNSVNFAYEAEWDTPSIVVLSVLGGLTAICILATLADYLMKRFTESELDKEALSMLGHSGSDATLGERSPLLTDLSASRATDYSVHPRKKNIFVKVLHAFSLYKNIPILLSNKTPAPELNILNLLRLVSIWWVVMGHTFLTTALEYAHVDLLNVFSVTKDSSVMIFLNAFFSVETFFYLSAFLVSYIAFNTENFLKKFNYLKYALFRYLRLTPSYALTLFFWTYVFKNLGEGPVWFRKVQNIKESCGNYWWTNMLYINNIYMDKIESVCMPWSWYLSVDYQLWLALPLFLLPLFYLSQRKWIGYLWLGAGTIGGLISVIVSNYVEKIPATFTGQGDGSMRWMTLFYFRPYSHLSVSLLAVFAAACASSLRARNYKINYVLIALSQALGAVLMIITVYYPYDEVKNPGTWTNLRNAMFNGFSKILWSLGLSFFILPSIINPQRTRLLTTFSAWSGWKVAAKLTYSVYLVHYMLNYVFFASRLREEAYKPATFVFNFGGVLWWSYLAAVLMFLFIEAPFGNLLKLLKK
jgi:peptidoglycan/LPS O-acetylase OafA/YrhL